MKELNKLTHDERIEEINNDIALSESVDRKLTKAIIDAKFVSDAVIDLTNEEFARLYVGGGNNFWLDEENNFYRYKDALINVNGKVKCKFRELQKIKGD